MHRSRRVKTGIHQGTHQVGTHHVDPEQISTPWKRSRNRVVQDEWRLQTGALSPTHGRARSPGRTSPGGAGAPGAPPQLRAQTAMGHLDRGGAPQSPFSQASGDAHLDKDKLARSLSSMRVSDARFTRMSSLDDSTSQSPTLWVQDRYFVRPKTQVRKRRGALFASLFPIPPPSPRPADGTWCSRRTKYESVATEYPSTAR